MHKHLEHGGDTQNGEKVLILANNDLGLYNFRKELIVRLLAESFQVFLAIPFDPRVPELIALGYSFIV